MGEELSGEVGRERIVGATPSSLHIVVQSFFEQLPCRGLLVNALISPGAWTHGEASAARCSRGLELGSELCLAPCSSAGFLFLLPLAETLQGQCTQMYFFFFLF